MKKQDLAAYITMLLVGAGIGRMLPQGGQDAPPTSGAVFPERLSGGSSEPARLESKAIPLEQAVAHSVPASGDAPGTAARENGMVLVPSALISELSRAAGTRTMDQELFSRDGRIEEVLKITDHEKVKIQTAWKGAMQRIRELETSTRKTEQTDEWTVRVTVPDLSSSMALIGKDLRSAVAVALGEERTETFLAVKQIDAMLAPSEGERTYTVTSESVGDGQWRYRMAMDGPDGRKVWVGDTIPDEIRHLTGDLRLAQ